MTSIISLLGFTDHRTALWCYGPDAAVSSPPRVGIGGTTSGRAGYPLIVAWGHGYGMAGLWDSSTDP